MKAEGCNWGERFIAQFYVHLTKIGHCGDRAADYSLQLGTLILSGKEKSQTEFCSLTADRLRQIQQQQGHLIGVDKKLASFLQKRRLTGNVRFGTNGYAGLTHKVIAGCPACFGVDLAAFYEDMIIERKYREETGESRPSERSVYNRIRSLSQWAQWLESRGYSSWQQLTPLVFREKIIELGVLGKNGIIGSHLGMLRTFLDATVRHGRLFRNPLSSVTTPVAPGLKQRPFDDQWIAEWFDRLCDEAASPDLRTVGLLCLLHGLYPKEMADLKDRDFDRRRRTLRVARRRLTINLDPLTLEAISAYLRIRPTARHNNHLFLSTTTRLSSLPVSSGFIIDRLRTLGMKTRDVRQYLIRQLAVEENVIVAARYFCISVDQVNRHMCHQGALIREQNQYVTECFQDNP